LKELFFLLIGIIAIMTLLKLPDLYPLDSRGIAYRISQEEIHAEIETLPARLVVFERLYLDKLLLNGSKNLSVDLDEFASELRRDLDKKGMEADIEYLLGMGACERVNGTLNSVFDGSSDPNSVGISTEVHLRISSRITGISGRRSYIIYVCHPYRKACFDRTAELLPRNSSLEESSEFNSTDELERWVDAEAKRHMNELKEALDRARTAAGSCGLDLIYSIDYVCNRVYSYKYVLTYRADVVVKQDDITLYYYGGSKRGISERFTVIWQIYLDGELSKIVEDKSSVDMGAPDRKLSTKIGPT